VKIGFDGWGGWEEEIIIDLGPGNTFEEVLEKFEGKKVRVTIQVIN
jgi:hypothetical protein